MITIGKFRILRAGFLLALPSLVPSCSDRPSPVVRPEDAIPPGIRIERVEMVPVADEQEAAGTVQSKTTTELTSQILARVSAVHVREGNPVRAGQLLISLDDRDLNARLRIAQAAVSEADEMLRETESGLTAADAAAQAAEAQKSLAEATHRRYQSLLQRKSISQQEFDEVEAKFRTASAEADRATRMREALLARKEGILARRKGAEAGVALAETQSSHSQIRAPFDGIVIGRNIEVGATVSPGLPILTLADHARYRLETPVDESLATRLQVGTTVTVVFDALGTDQVIGTIGEILPAADPATRTILVKINLPADARLRSGMFGKARFSSGQRSAVTVPVSALVEQGQLRGLYVVDQDRRAHLRLVQSGKRRGDRIEITSGLMAGEQVIVEGAERVKDGVRVQP